MTNTSSGTEPIVTTPRRPWLGGGAVAGGLVGALVAALAGLCCVGPVTVLLLGAGGAVAAAGLAPYRLPLLAVSALLLGVGYWRAYRSRSTAAGACPPRIGRWIRVSFTIAAVAWIAAVALWLTTIWIG